MRTTGIVKSEGLNLRAFAHWTAKSLDELDHGDRVEVYERRHLDGDGDWLRVKVIGKAKGGEAGAEGWVKESTRSNGVLVELDPDPEPRPRPRPAPVPIPFWQEWKAVGLALALFVVMGLILAYCAVPL